jgi:hypothetical protein
MDLSFHAGSHERLLRRMDIASRNREESVRIKVVGQIERESVRRKLDELKSKEFKEVAESLKIRRNTWRGKLANSPLSVDLVQEDKQRFLRLMHEKKSSQVLSCEKERVNAEIDKEAMQISLDQEPFEMDVLRRNKREILLQMKQLRAMRDVERTISRSNRITRE